MITDYKLYTISEVAEKLNLSTKTLRRWEADGKFQASRTIGGQRRYTLEDLQILDAIKHGTIPAKSDLLTLQQAANLFGVTPQTIIRWENEGKIHPFITSGNTYYPKSRLVEKIEHLKQSNNMEFTQGKVNTEPTYNKLNHPQQIANNINNHKQPTPTLNPFSPTNPQPLYRTEFISSNSTTSLPRTPNPETPVGTPLAKGEIWGRTLKLPKGPLPPKVGFGAESRNLIYTILINFIFTSLLLLSYHTLFSHNFISTQAPTPSIPPQTPLEKTLQSIFSLTGDLNTPGSITTRSNLVVGQSLTLLPSTPPLKPAPGTLYYDASSQTLRVFSQKHWLSLPNSQPLQPQKTTLVPGKAVLSKNNKTLTITNKNITPKTQIIITFTSDYSPARKYWITQKTGQFTLHLDFPPAHNTSFTYLLLIPTQSH